LPSRALAPSLCWPLKDTAHLRGFSEVLAMLCSIALLALRNALSLVPQRPDTGGVVGEHLEHGSPAMAVSPPL